MSKVRQFHLGDILSVTTGRLVSPRKMEGVYDICDFLTGDQNYTHQLPRAARECTPWIFKQHPQLEAVEYEHVDTHNWREWLDEQVRQFGETLPLTPMPRDMHTHIDPLEEIEAMVGKDKVIVVEKAND